ncbi:MAG: hypothetical protein SFV51_11640 [Bryobacteraceae bacterium]|nr:hypothetical protein [Bryobacteraceae bacterium]
MRRQTFKNAVFKDSSGRAFRIEMAELEINGARRRQVHLRLSVRGPSASAPPDTATIELSRKEAYALSEWLDEVLTAPE